MKTRGITREDFHHVVSVIDQWWGGPTSALAHPSFFYEFGQYALIVEEEGRLAGFLLGFITDANPRVAYVHLVGIDPEFRRRGVGRALYEEFTLRAKAAGATKIKAITTPGNQGSVEFHRALGYSVELVSDYAGPNRARYVFLRDL